MNIRQALLSDLPYIYDICRLTGKNGKDSSDLIRDNYIIGQYFAAPYLHFEIDTCFVLDNGSIPLGYILGTSSTMLFNEWMNTSWLPSVRKHYNSDLIATTDFDKFLIDIINQDCEIPGDLIDYPAHLHIDLLPAVQNRGYGKQMMKKFIAAITDKGSKGVHLSVALKNVGAIEFYKKNDFFEIRKDSGALFFGLKTAD
ncbi:MAG: GNAT family N-acetyltransferase [Spirochaetes bacterium]|nr:GNAT family N-acetyltransferase [Spirochaetota bacterium]